MNYILYEHPHRPFSRLYMSVCIYGQESVIM